jgi:hypothetical protein
MILLLLFQLRILSGNPSYPSKTKSSPGRCREDASLRMIRFTQEGAHQMVIVRRVVHQKTLHHILFQCGICHPGTIQPKKQARTMDLLYGSKLSALDHTKQIHNC